MENAEQTNLLFLPHKQKEKINQKKLIRKIWAGEGNQQFLTTMETPVWGWGLGTIKVFLIIFGSVNSTLSLPDH